MDALNRKLEAKRERQLAAKRKRFTFAVDWDGTCVEGIWPRSGDWLPGATTALRELDSMGTVVIYSCRVAPFEFHQPGEMPTWRDPLETEREIRGIRAMLDSIGLGHIEVWTRPYKPPALVYIDDRAIPFRGVWSEVLNQVEAEIEATDG